MASDSKKEAINFVIDQDDDLSENDMDYDKMMNFELKELCRQCGLANSGRKQDLIDRLEDYTIKMGLSYGGGMKLRDRYTFQPSGTDTQPNATNRSNRFDGIEHYIIKSEQRGYCKH